MKGKSTTNKVIYLAIVGFIVSQIAGGFIIYSTDNILFGLVSMVFIFSGVLGKKVLERVGGVSAMATIVSVVVMGAWSKWWLYIIYYFLALFIGNILSNLRPGWEEEAFKYETELVYDLIDEKDNFAIKFPARPRLSEGRLQGSRTYGYDYKGALSMRVHISSTAELTSLAPDGLSLLDFEIEMLNRAGANGFEYEVSEWQGFTCIDATLRDEDDNTFYKRVVITNNRKYTVILVADKSSEHPVDELYDRFVGSFRIFTGNDGDED